MNASTKQSRLESLARGESEAIDLDEAMLLSIGYAHPQLDIQASIEELDAFGGALADRLDGADGLRERLDRMNAYLFEECGFRGNRDQYYDPRNSYLHEVITRRLGIPITLSVIAIEVGRRAGLALDGVSFPYHFLCAPRDVDGVFIDTFSRGARVLDRQACRAMLHRNSKGQIAFRDEFLSPVTKREVVVRVMRNLKLVHLRAVQIREAIACIDCMLLWEPRLVHEWRDRGMLYAQDEQWGEAIENFETYLQKRPGAPDRMRVEMEIMEAREQRVTIH